MVGHRHSPMPAVRIRRQAEAEPDAQVVEKLSDLGLKVTGVVHEDQHAAPGNHQVEESRMRSSPHGHGAGSRLRRLDLAVRG
jgi:hypothetical protein